MTQLKHIEGPHFPLLHLFVLQALSGLDVAHPCQGGQSALLSLTQMLVSSGNNLTDTPRNHIHPNIWAPHDPVKLTHGINHHSHHFHPSPPLCLCTWLPGDTETQKINLVIKRKKKKEESGELCERKNALKFQKPISQIQLIVQERCLDVRLL